MKKGIISLYVFFSNRSNSSRLSNYCLRYLRIVTVLCINFIVNPKLFFRAKNRVNFQQLEQNPLVSIIIPTFNQCQFLPQCLDSITRQTYKHYEVIIVNDGSTDETQTVLKKYHRHCKGKVINNDLNLGLPKSLNIGFNEAKGKLVTWVSSDNYLSSNFVESFVSVLLRNPDAAVAYSNFSVIDEDGEEIKSELGWRNYDRIAKKSNSLIMHRFKDIEKVNPVNIVGASFMMRKEVFEEVGGYFGAQGTEDQIFWISASKVFSFLKLETQQTLYYYRFHKNSLTRKVENRDYWSLLRQNRPKK